MKSRRVLLVLVVLAGFYYVTTRVSSTGALAPWIHKSLGLAGPVPDAAMPGPVTTATTTGPGWDGLS